MDHACGIAHIQQAAAAVEPWREKHCGCLQFQWLLPPAGLLLA
jgi:hypothetical protein